MKAKWFYLVLFIICCLTTIAVFIKEGTFISLEKLLAKSLPILSVIIGFSIGFYYTGRNKDNKNKVVKYGN